MQRCIIIFLFLTSTSIIAQENIIFSSPDKKLEAHCSNKAPFTFTLWYHHKKLMHASDISMQWEGFQIPAAGSQSLNSEIRKVDEKIIPLIPQKNHLIRNQYIQLLLTFQDGSQLEFRIYDNGTAYRFITHIPHQVHVVGETGKFSFHTSDSLWFPHVPDQDPNNPFQTSFELQYPFRSINTISHDSLSPTPVLIQVEDRMKIGILESNVRDYPGMFLRGSSSTPHALEMDFPTFPLRTRTEGETYQTSYVTDRASFIAETSGERTFPWRVFLFAEKDQDFLNNELVYLLADPARPDIDFSWVKPGKAMDNWIIDGFLEGVDFKSGNNTESYKYYIDFAAKYRIPYIMVEPVWGDIQHILKPVPEMNMHELYGYAHQKNIGLWLWTEALALQKNMEVVLDTFQKWGAPGFMVDFFNRNDQEVMIQLETIAESAARHHLMLMFHGVFPSAGFERTWPNVLTREAVAGSEYNKWANWITPTHNLCLPFIRGLSGPFDYEPLVMPNATIHNFLIDSPHPQTQTTRAGELAKFIVYSSPFQVISGSPVDFIKNDSLIRFLAEIPTTWDHTIPLDAEVGHHILVAREKNGIWYLAGMTNEKERYMDVDLTFLPAGNYHGKIICDGETAWMDAKNYSMHAVPIDRKKSMRIWVASGGGFVIKIEGEKKLFK